MTWLQPDPLGEVDGYNVYAYAGWDPFNKIDPMGLAALGWGEFFTDYLFGSGAAGQATRAAFHDGATDGAVIVSNTLTFGLNDDLNNAEAQIVAAGKELQLGKYYVGAQIVSWIGRESLIFVATAGVGTALQAGAKVAAGTRAGRDTIAAALIFLGVHGADMNLVAKIVRYVLGAGAVAATANRGHGLAEGVARGTTEAAEACAEAAIRVPTNPYNVSTAGMTAAERQAVVEYAQRTNAWLAQNGGSTTVQSTAGTLRSEANAAARLERLRAARAGTPYSGQAGHVPDTALTGTGTPPAGWLDMPGRSNSVVGGGLSSRIGQVIDAITVDGVIP